MSQSFHYYNPDWLSDEALIANFVARQGEFTFLRDELSRVPQSGNVQHYLLVGVRGAGKTTLLKRLAAAIRQDNDLNDHLIALSFPEELYQVKNLSDFWWAACDALADELERLKLDDEADRLLTCLDQPRPREGDPLCESGLTLLQQTCHALVRRPVLLVDNLDFIFQRIDKSGRKLKNPHSPAYWALREALSTQDSPVVIGGSVRLSEPFTDYDKAFYDFFLPRRLGKLSLQEVQRVLECLAKARNLPEVEQQLKAHPGRIEALHELTGGNPRALSFIFDLLHQGPNGRAVEDFERLMDITTPYYKARFEDLSEQAQVVMHALAVRRPGNDGLRFGHTAAEIGEHAGLPTNTVSTQLDILVREGLVEKDASYGRMQYRITEQLFRLWLQMRANRRIRQNVIGLTEFLEALFDLENVPTLLRETDTDCATSLANAHFAFALADTQGTESVRRGLEAYGADHLLQHIEAEGGDIEDFFSPGDLSEDLNAIVDMRARLKKCRGGGLKTDEQKALLGAIELTLDKKCTFVAALCLQTSPEENVEQVRQYLATERQRLLRKGLQESDLALLFQIRTQGYLPLPNLTTQDVEAAANLACNTKAKPGFRAAVWRLAGAESAVRFATAEIAASWLAWGQEHAVGASAAEWTNVANAMRGSEQFEQAKVAYHRALEKDPDYAVGWRNLGLALVGLKRFDEAEAAYRQAIALKPRYVAAWNSLGNLLSDRLNCFDEAEAAYRSALEIDSSQAFIWRNLGIVLEDVKRFDEAEAAYHQATSLEPDYAEAWRNLGLLQASLGRFDEAEAAYRKAIESKPDYIASWNSLGNLLTDNLKRFDEAEAAYYQALEIDPAYALVWRNLGLLLIELTRFDEAETAYRKAIESQPDYIAAWNSLGNLLTDNLKRFDEAETAYRKVLEIDHSNSLTWRNLGLLLVKMERFDEAETAYRKAIELTPDYIAAWNNLGNLLTDNLKRFDEAEVAYRKVLEIDHSNSLAWRNLGLLLVKMERFDEAETAYRKVIESKPDYVAVWINLGNLLADKLERFDDAETAYRKAIEIKPNYGLAWLNLGRLLTRWDRFDEADEACKRGASLVGELSPFWREACVSIQVMRYIEPTLRALEVDNWQAVSETLRRLLSETSDIAAALVSLGFVEDFLAVILSDHQKAAQLLSTLRELGFEKHARPLLLAFEAINENRQEMLDALEPEVQGAAKRMWKRLMDGMTNNSNQGN
ncbi:tetratricopeptide repeat protein [Dickeya fangzhongdai]|uniref:tetratricopeptide repeat protein n=1 Tax=Dickeya fangzhongdai TaxID=1778540 RepID=UPI002B2E599D|nr:tetratricopeptide repeat protein [Dickeya fangzhongdai]